MFSQWDRWDMALAAVAVYIAVMSLVRLMRERREQLLVRFRQEVQAEQRRRVRRGPSQPAAKKAPRDAA